MSGWEQFSAEKGYEGTRTYVHVTAASSQPKRANDIFFSFLLKWQLAVYRLQTTIKEAELFHPSVFTPTIFSFLYYYDEFAFVKQCLPCLKSHLPAPVRPAVPRCTRRGCPATGIVSSGCSNWGQAILTFAGAQTRQVITILLLGLSFNFSSPCPRAIHRACLLATCFTQARNHGSVYWTS